MPAGVKLDSSRPFIFRTPRRSGTMATSWNSAFLNVRCQSRRSPSTWTLAVSILVDTESENIRGIGIS